MHRFTGIKQLLNRNNKRYFINTVLPDVPLSSEDVYIITQDGDRLDNLSYEFYNDTQYWWVILAANPNKLRKDSYHVALGEQIRIPANPSRYVDTFINFNNNNR
jgi:phage tail protein X